MAQVGIVNPQPDSWVPTCVGEANFHLAIAEEFGSAKIGTDEKRLDDDLVNIYFETEELLELKLCMFANIVCPPKRLDWMPAVIQAVIATCLDDIKYVGGGIIKEEKRESKIESIASNTYKREPDNSEEYKKLRNEVAQRLGRWCADLDAAYAKYQQKLENTMKKKMAEKKEKRRIKEKFSFKQLEQTEKKLAFEQPEETEKK